MSMEPWGARRERKKMSFEKAVNYLKQKGYESRVIVPGESTATVDLAAHALGTEPGAIAKTMSLLVDGKPLLILTEGTARIDNHKFKETFHTKAKMIPADQVEELVGHAPGGICPFGIYEGIPVCLDKSIKKHDTVYPAAGDDHSCVRLTLEELEEAIGNFRWVDVCKETVS